MFGKKEKAQTSIEILMILGVLVIGGIILGVFYLSMANDRTTQATNLANTDYTSWLDDNITSTATSVYCGNGFIEVPEECDTTNLNGHTCANSGYVSGTLTCNLDCTLNKSNCINDPITNPICGDRIVSGSEQCDTTNNGMTCDVLLPGTIGTVECYPPSPFNSLECTYDGRGCTNLLGGCGDGVCSAPGECTTCPADCSTDPQCQATPNNLLLYITPETGGSANVNQGFLISADTSESTPTLKYTLKVDLEKQNAFFVYEATSNCRYNGGVRASSITLGSNLSPSFTTYAPFDCNTAGTYKLKFTMTDDTNANAFVSKDSTWTIVPANTVATPMAEPVGGTYPETKLVNLTCATPANIYYTINGVDPIEAINASNFKFTPGTPISIATSTTLKAKAFKTSLIPSAVMTERYDLNVNVPIAVPGTGSYNNTQSILLSTTPNDANIYYTTNGADPTIASTKYTGAPIVITGGTVGSITTLKAKAYKTDFNPSQIMIKAYNFTVASISTDLTPGTYSSSQEINLSTLTSGADIYYTTDGITIPTSSSTKFVPGNPIIINSTTTIKAIGIKNTYTNSNVSTFVYTLNVGQVAPVLMTPIGGIYSNTLSVELTCTTPGATIRYTTDGSTPTDTSTSGTSITVTPANHIINAMAFKTGLTPSIITTEEYDFKAAKPIASLPGRTYTSEQTITLSSTTDGVTIHYTDNGSTPTEDSPIYMNPIPINFNTTIKAIAYKPGYADSSIMTEEYHLRTATPTANPGAGTYDVAQNVTLSSTNGDFIYFTKDGTTPTTTLAPNNFLYGGPILVNLSTTLKAISQKTGWDPSLVMSANYVLKEYCNDIDVPLYVSDIQDYYTYSRDVQLTSDGCSGDFTNPDEVIFTNPKLDSDVIRENWAGETKSAETFCESHGGVYVDSVMSGSGLQTPYFGDYLELGNNTSHSTSPILLWGQSVGQPNVEYYTSITCDFTAQELDVQIPVATPAGSFYYNTQLVSLSSTSGATIYYTTNGADPTETVTTSNLLYTSPISVTLPGTTLKAKAYKTGMNPSDVSADSYYFKAATPTSTPVPGIYVPGTQVTLTSLTSGADIYYTTNGSEPTQVQSGTNFKYTGPITLNTTTTLKVKAFKTNMTASNVYTANYTIAPAVATLVATPIAGSYPVAGIVTLSTTTSGASIYYTLNGDEPTLYQTETNFKYNSSDAVPIYFTTTLKAKAFKTGYPASNIFSGVYTIAPLQVSSIATGSTTCIVLQPTGQLSCWGDNHYGQYGNGTTIRKLIPSLISNFGNVSQVDTGFNFNCALLANKTVRCAGNNEYGQLGDGTTTNSLTPVTVSGLTNVTQISLGQNNACALLTNGTVKCWGWNGSGQLGDGTTTNSSTPVLVSDLNNVSQISTSGHSCAILLDKTVKCWGNNYSGALGDGTTTNRLTPVLVSGLTNVTSIAVSDTHSCAIAANSQLKCWGGNENGQLGDGTFISRYTPVDVPNLGFVTQISLGQRYSCALLLNKTVKCWGDNWSGQLGNGITGVSGQPYPSLVFNLNNVTLISADWGNANTCAFSSNTNTLKCWGDNFFGQIGDGTRYTDRVIPVTVRGFQ